LKPRDRFEFPESLRGDLARARRLEWISLAALSSMVVLIYLTMGQSQTMRAALVENILSMVPAAAFLVADRVRLRRPDADFPFGYHRAVSIAFLAGAVALTILGGFILVESVLSLAGGHRPVIGLAVVAGREVWAGWLMVAVLVYSGVVPFFLGRMKTDLARRLHDKTLSADADMNRADWLTAGAGIAGIVGVGAGLWWADSVAAAVISGAVLWDGIRNLRRVVAELMDRRPTEVDGEVSDVGERVRAALLECDWVSEAAVRLREEGHVFTGEAFVILAGEGTAEDTVRWVEEAADIALGVDWRIHDMVVSPVRPPLKPER
jgi:cation diffusion facilitator family transporter